MSLKEAIDRVFSKVPSPGAVKGAFSKILREIPEPTDSDDLPPQEKDLSDDDKFIWNLGDLRHVPSGNELLDLHDAYYLRFGNQVERWYFKSKDEEMAAIREALETGKPIIPRSEAPKDWLT